MARQSPPLSATESPTSFDQLDAASGAAVSRRELELAVWGHEQEASDNLRSVLLTLRKALAGSGVEIENVHGLGYKLVIA